MEDGVTDEKALVEPHLIRHWERFDAAYYGALVGILLALAYSLSHVFLGDAHDDTTLARIAAEMLWMTAAGALLGTFTAEIRNRLVWAETSAKDHQS